MDEDAVRKSAEAFNQAVLKGDYDLLGTYFADELRAKSFAMVAKVHSCDVVGVEYEGDEVVVQTRFHGDPAKLIETYWTDQQHSAPRTMAIGGPATLLKVYWTEQYGQPRVAGFQGAAFPRIPPD